MYAYDDKALAKCIKEAGKGYTLQRYKGLGEMNPEQLWDTTMNPATRRLIRVEPSDEEITAQMFDVLLGDNLNGRKEFIAERGNLYLEQVDLS